MIVRRLTEATRYEAPNHRDIAAFKLQSAENGGPTNQWVGLSRVLPGGGAGPDSTPFEKVYVVIEGQLTVITADERVVLGPLDSITIAPGEVREMLNETHDVCSLIVVIPYANAVAS